MNVSGILPFYNSFCPLVFNTYVDKFLRFISGGTGVNWVCQFLFIPAYLENETSKTALKLRSSDVTTKYVEVLYDDVHCSLPFLKVKVLIGNLANTS